MSSGKERIPFRVRMADGSIETVYAYSEKQALFLASRSGKRALSVVGILMEKHKAEEEVVMEAEEEMKELIEKLADAIKNGQYFDAMEYKIQIQKAIAEGRINWSNNMEKRFKIFGIW
ncbi:MAG: hypothetical protein QXI93_03260 [Candidatus Methanomethylicia archaeon]